MAERDDLNCGSGNACSCGGSGAGASAEVSRRLFLQVAGGTGLGLLSASTMSGSMMAGPFERREAGGVGIQHFVPVDKKLDPSWVKSLMTREVAARAYSGAALGNIGMPIGGIGAGQLYLRGDGTLSYWQIFNRHYFSGYGLDNYDQPPTESPVEQGFAVAYEQRGRAVVRRLDQAGFEQIEFVGEYPIGVVRYREAGLPIEVELKAFSPFIPLNAGDSALPASVFQITVRNTSADPLHFNLLGWLENAVCQHSAAYLQADRRTVISAAGSERSFVEHGVRGRAEDEKTKQSTVLVADFEGVDYGDWTVEGSAFGRGPARGTLPTQQPVQGFKGQGLVNSFIDGDSAVGRLTSPAFELSRHYLNFQIGGGNHPNETCINLLVDGAVVRTATGRNGERLNWQAWEVREFAGQAAQIQIVDAHTEGWGHINIDQIEMADVARGGPAGPLEEIEDFGTLTLALDGRRAPSAAVKQLLELLPSGDIPIEVSRIMRGDVYPVHERRSGGIASERRTLAAGAEEVVTFVLAWHFPNQENGHEYANRFASSTEVANYVLNNKMRLFGDTQLWHDTYYESTLPHWLLERLHSPVSTLATGTCQWWGNGRFWAWEGVGCCSGTCTHVWNYAHAPARLFPSLERSVREMQDLGMALHGDGLVGFRGQLNNAYAADGQAGTVLKCYREHLISSDDEFLVKNWPKIKQVLSYLIAQDGDDDGLIENSQHNTYDIEFHGANTFVGALYLAALRAGTEMARKLGEGKFADRLQQIFEAGQRHSVERLFNGEYFVQDIDLDEYPQHQYGVGCLSDQLFGQSWADQLGLGYLYPKELVQETLRSIWKYNWAPDVRAQNEAHPPERWFVAPGEAGLFTCTWPKSEFLVNGVRYRNEIWTGIEYQVASHLIHEGMLTEGLAMVRGIHDRYDGRKRNPFNEVECGDHYARALASWGVFISLCGFEYDGPRGRITFAPRITPEDFRAAFTTAEAWGVFSQTIDAENHRATLAVRWGGLRLLSITLERGKEGAIPLVSVTAKNRRMITRVRMVGSRAVIEFSRKVFLEAGDQIEIVMS